jgi:hypothetical protein
MMSKFNMVKADMDIRILIVVGSIVIALIIVIWRVGASYGKIRPSREVTAAYECFTVDPNLNYYISGSDTYPNAIIGIDKTWTLGSEKGFRLPKYEGACAEYAKQISGTDLNAPWLRYF